MNIIYNQHNSSVYFTSIWLVSGDSLEQYTVSDSNLLLKLECQSDELASLRTEYRALLAKQKFEKFQSTHVGFNLFPPLLAPIRASILHQFNPMMSPMNVRCLYLCDWSINYLKLIQLGKIT